MAKRRRKANHCLNCNNELNIKDSFCSKCGQENTNNKVHLNELLKDIFSNYFNLDTRFGRVVIPFLFKPGLLTVDFNKGKRLKYMNPLKLYIMMSLFYFFVFSWLTMPVIEESLSNFDDIDERVVDEAKNELENDFSTNADSTRIMHLDSTESQVKTSIDTSKVKLSVESDILITDGLELNTFLKWIQDREMTPARFLDSLGLSEKNKKELLFIKMAKQTLKIGRNDPHIFVTNIIDNIPIMMLFLLPILAMYLKIIYIRSSKYYIEHLIFTLHLQAFIYFIFALGLIAMYWLDFIDVTLVMGLVIFIYSFAMFYRVHQQGWFKTFLKMHILTFFYFFSLTIFLIIEILVSFFTF